MSTEQIVRTTVWSAGPGCHGGCGAKVYVKDGKVVKVEGDEDHPWSQGRLCPRALAMTQYMYHPDRIRYPMKRVGKRGEGKWERISWDEAYDTVEHRLKELRDKYGAESVVFIQGTGRDIGGPITLLMYNYGSPNWLSPLTGIGCYTPRLVAMHATMGDYCVMDASQFLAKRYDDPEWTPPRVIIVWGQNPAAADPDGFYGHWVIDCMKRGSRLIVIDPRTNWIASRAELHLQCRPGTDAAMALGMLNVIINEGLYDKEFVDRWCYGFDELKDRVQQYPPEKASEITWVPKEKIIAAARLYATSKPAAIQWGQTIDMNAEGAVAAQAINHIWAITGNIDVPGGNVIAKSSHGVTPYPFSRTEMINLYGEELFTRLSEKRIGADRYPVIKNFRAWAQPDVFLEQMESGKPYPIKGAWLQTCNFLSCMASDIRRQYEALQRLDFIAFVDLFLNPTSQALGDIFLPAATFAEKQSLRSWWAPLCAIVKATEVDECKSDWEINLELARRLNPRFPYKTVKELFDDRLKGTGKTYDSLVEQGGWEMPPEGPTRPYRRWERGLLRKDGKPGFNTPTAKVELWSTFFEQYGYDPLPFYEEQPESPVSTPELYKEYPLILSTGARTQAFFHSEHRMIPWLRELEPDPNIQINPGTAKDLGIMNGEWVYVENHRGRVKAKAKVTPEVPPWLIMAAHGWWLPETEGAKPNLYGVFEVGINNLMQMGQQGRCGFGGGSQRSVLCRVTRIRD
ncbi:MAG: molybdopterin-dependent oxidoreductase [Dehalococcoidia bacterium]|nr:molybdopterin-dependent oxidoreductase [Dehalococcoidia bacterium]